MQKYIDRSHVAGAIDAIGGKIGVLLVCVGWFIYLWGLCWPAIIAGLGLCGLCLLCIRLFDQRTLEKREAALRRTIGGELALEELLLMKEDRAQFQAAMWLLPKYPVTLIRLCKGHILCEWEGKRVITVLLSRHPASPITADELLGVRRLIKTQGAERALVCATAPLSAPARDYAAQCPHELTLIHRDELISLAGAASPATNEQLLSLKSRRKKRLRFHGWLRLALAPDRAKSYFLYGLGMAALSLITGQPYYPIPAVICLTLCILCRLRATKAPDRDRGSP